MKTFGQVYQDLLSRLLTFGVEERNQRTGATIRILRGGESFKLGLGGSILPTCGLRKTYPHVAAAELAWCLLGHDHVRWLTGHTKVWDQFAEWDASPTRQHNPGHMDAAYGYRWRYKFGRDQLQLAINALRKDPSDRRIWISSWDPSEDGLGAPDQKTVPCPVGFTLSIVDGYLDSTFLLRSSDTFMGLPHDVARHAYLMKALACTLKVTPGVMQVSVAHPHLYDKHFALAERCLAMDIIEPAFGMPYKTIDDIVARPDEYVKLERETAKMVTWPTYSPKVSVVA